MVSFGMRLWLTSSSNNDHRQWQLKSIHGIGEHDPLANDGVAGVEQELEASDPRTSEEKRIKALVSSLKAFFKFVGQDIKTWKRKFELDTPEAAVRFTPGQYISAFWADHMVQPT